MSDPDLFLTLCGLIAANIIVLVLAYTNAIRESGRFRSDGGQS
jgi:hypothetical protein